MISPSENPTVAPYARFRKAMDQSYQDLGDLSGLHPDFVADAISAIVAKRNRVNGPLLGELFPHLVSQSLRVDDGSRRRMAAAWLALYGYISLVDFQLDRLGRLDTRASMSASALLSWGVATISEITAHTPFNDIFLKNLKLAFAAQHEDLQNRSCERYHRAASDKNKNRAIVAVVAGYCAAGREKNDRLVRATELLLGPFQLLDDLQDVCEDLKENNVTIFVRIVRELSWRVPGQISDETIYPILLSHPQTLTELRSMINALTEALLILNSDRDVVLIEFFVNLRKQAKRLVSTIRRYQENPEGVCEKELIRNVRLIVCAS